MTNKQIWIVAGVATGLTGIGLYLYYQDKSKRDIGQVNTLESSIKKLEQVHKASTVKKVGIKKEQELTKMGDDFPLRLGSQGKRVERMQVWLMRNFGGVGTVNGTFDQATQQRLQKYLKLDQLDELTFNKYKMGSPVHEQVIR